ncbi:site-specific DNA-methyltransferase [Acidiphilium iwatense]|uniref:site-specific DNA-methyltransferase (adenine-specific) n=1 Tax=Acidiphilium iwatense TaxID=768198 RepID=A0ABS9DZJ0_9PROT|nr:site-specific DNA-methyltransferase [Acidiphilium iwatense]MCF3948186.1 site-specific DNA-methyltransferase [Acidiphilium iwatense]
MNDGPVTPVGVRLDPLAGIELLDQEDLIRLVRSMMSNGVALTFHGKRSAKEISRKVRPRVMRREPRLHVGSPAEQSRNLLIEGENLQTMVTLYKYRGEVDLIVTDPPYNTGQQFRYNDKWDEDPNDPDLGTLVAKEDGSRHTKWIKAMMPRLQMMKAMLKPSGVIAICIDDNELFHLGMLMDEVFGEENRIGILNWQKAAAARPDNSHISSATEYVLIYSKDTETARTYSLDRSEKDNRRYGNPDRDPSGIWREGNLTARTYSTDNDYGIQSPFTGEVHYPAGNGAWRHPKRNLIGWLGEWGVPYEIRSIKDGKRAALMVVGQKPGKISSTHMEAAQKRLESGPWPFVWFGTDGTGRPRVKTYLERIRKGKVPTTYWASEDLSSDEVPFVELGATSWDYTESGRSADGVSELTSIVGKGHGFDTVKPLKLFKKIIQLWCPPQGLVLDPYAGSGTTGQAVLEVNQEGDADRRFILIEQGSPATGDKYARSLTWQRLHNVITGQRLGPDGKLTNGADPVLGGFEFRMLTRQIDAKTVLSMKKDELVDVVITSHWDMGRRGSTNLIRIDDPKYSYLVGCNEQGEGYFIIWNNGGPVGQLDLDSYRIVLKDAEKARIKPPYHVYARYEVYQSRNVQFWKIPDKILAHLGLNENSDRFNDDEISG